jgi:HSP20 family protein
MKEDKNLEQKYTESPDIITFVDSEQAKLRLEISFVGVEKENIRLLMDENGCYFSAPTDDAEYVAAISFLRPVKPSEAKTVFEEGLLRVEIPFRDPLRNYVEVPIEEDEK